MKAAVKGLYAVTPDILDTAELAAKVEAALAGGASVVQYRNKAAGGDLRVAQARSLQALCRAKGVPLVINDDLELAAEIDAPGLHLGKDDASLQEARALMGPEKLLGASCYNHVDSAITAIRAGADYVAFGSFFPSTVKPGAVHAPVSLLREAKQRIGVPIVAIGGITLDNAPQLISAGADAVAVISALFSAPDICVAAVRFSRLFSSAPAI